MINSEILYQTCWIDWDDWMETKLLLFPLSMSPNVTAPCSPLSPRLNGLNVDDLADKIWVGN